MVASKEVTLSLATQAHLLLSFNLQLLLLAYGHVRARLLCHISISKQFLVSALPCWTSTSSHAKAPSANYNSDAYFALMIPAPNTVGKSDALSCGIAR